MISLFLDTCSAKLVVGIYKDLEELYLSIEDNDNNLSERVLVSIDKALECSKVKKNQIDNIFIVNGPGSFTGTRIGVTVAKVMAWGLKKNIYPISELELLASNSTKNYIVPMIDARRNCVYAGMYDKEKNIVFENGYMKLDELYNKVKRHSKIDDVEFVSFDKIIYEKILNINEPKLDIISIISKHLNDIPVNPHSVNPVYLKLTEAEENLKVNV